MIEPGPPRRAQQRQERGRLIVESARAMAEADGWDGVTTRRLAGAIGYTQPVLYGHFPDGKPEIMRAVALQGFRELKEAMSAASAGAPTAGLRAMVTAYLDYAEANPAVYQAMFVLPIGAGFATEDAGTELKSGFRTMSDVLRSRWPDPEDLETATELFWSSLHGLVTLGGAERLRPSARRARIDGLAEVFSPQRSSDGPTSQGSAAGAA